LAAGRRHDADDPRPTTNDTALVTFDHVLLAADNRPVLADPDALPLVQDKLADRVATWLREAIMSGRLRSGENLRLVALAGRLGVSTTPVREALVHLQKEGLVVGEPRKGFTVARLSRADIRDLFFLHAFIAGVLAERAATRLSTAELEALATLNGAIKLCVAAGDQGRAAQLKQDFHRIINKAAGPSILHRFLADMSRWTGPQVAGWPAGSGQDHGAIVAALRRRDGARARSLIERHVRRAGEQVVTHLAEHGTVLP
jgi:DNA-binding GntR family transcriptional regulator